MSSQQQLHLADAQKRLETFQKHLDLLARCSSETEKVDANAVLSAVTELQSLVEWAAQQPGLGAESAILLVKLQELHEIKENLEKKPAESVESSTTELQCEKDCAVSNPSEENHSKDAETTSGTVTPNLDDINEDNVQEDDSFNLSGDKESLCDFSASTEDPNLANAESPQSIEDQNADIIPSDERADEVVITDENEYPSPVNDPKDNLENEKCKQENLEMQELSRKEISESVSRSSDLKSPNLYRSEVIIIETDEDNKTKEWSGDFKNSNDPLDICMYAIRNLYESLRVKENELLKLSTMQNDQKHIEALQGVIIDFHKDKTNLNNQLENYKKENRILKEQVLELEEAENDARLEAQNLGLKLAFLQEKDSHTQAELTQLKQNVKKNENALAEKATVENELRSQMKYMETLVQKYEDQIKELETKEAACCQRLQEMEQKLSELVSKIQEKTAGCDRGTQTYPPSRTKINNNGEEQANNCGVDSLNSTQSTEVLEDCKAVELTSKYEDTDSSLQSTSATEKNQPKDFIFTNEECISQTELFNRLHKLMDEDVNLQQQIHNVDQINLTLWKKLQNLDNHIGECKRQNINETDLVVDKDETKESSKVSSGIRPQELSDNVTNENIPIENSNCLDENDKCIYERLKKIEEINESFKKELKTRENICKEKEKKYAEWMETESRFIDNLKYLASERDSLTDQIISIKKEKIRLQKNTVEKEEYLKTLKEKNQAEITKIKAEEESSTEELNNKVSQLLAKEKEILKMIASLKVEKSKSQNKSELEKLKCGYIELQLELSHYREQINKIKEQFKIILDECAGKHLQEENKIVSELEILHHDNIKCDKIISDLEMKQRNLLDILEKQEKHLEIARENFKKDLEETDEEHRSIESELKTQLHQMEERTVVATTVLMKERNRVEKELQNNVEDLRVKEKVYKAKIAELEQDVTHLHDELHKIATMSESKAEVPILERFTKEEMPHKISEISREKVAENKNVSYQSSVQKPDPIPSFKSPHKTIVECPPSTSKEHLLQTVDEKNKAEEEIVEENVNELRAQVRELQNQLEKISGAEYETPTAHFTQPLKPAKACVGSQKLEDLDYAEVDYCCLDAWKKIPKYTDSDAIPSNFQGVYDDKHLTGYKEKLKYEGQHAKKEPVEENDYDEVLPRPTNFHVVQQVGSDTLLVGWNYVNPSILDGFEVYLGDQVHERIYIPDRTKALISGLNLKKPIHLSICALSRYGQMSEPAVLDLSFPIEFHSKYFEDECDEYRDFEDLANQKPRPYSMEW